MLCLPVTHAPALPTVARLAFPTKRGPKHLRPIGVRCLRSAPTLSRAIFRLRHSAGAGVDRTGRAQSQASGAGTFHKLIYWNEVQKGGHFAAWEEPDSSPRRSEPRADRSAEAPGR